ncbi:MAG: hypothetical protein IH897_10555, partial [Planctomycetes bacterium]|nr:hypothetical protein [Planctomycetota bacterium]
MSAKNRLDTFLQTIYRQKAFRLSKVDPDKVHVEAQGHLLRVKVAHRPDRSQGGGVRGNVATFSTASRKRMLELLARMDLEQVGFTCFVTLTYPEREGPPVAAECDRDRATFLKRIGRSFEETSGIWRREWERRRSGEFLGHFYPHFHILFFSLPFVQYDEINTMWRGVLAYDGYVRTEIQGIKSWRQAMYYVSKYMAKPSDVGQVGPPEGGQPDPKRAAPPPGDDAPGASSCSLVYVSYLTGNECHPGKSESLSIGRSWGVFNRKCLPVAERKVATFSSVSWIREVKDIARETWEGVNDYPNTGFTLFVENPEEWIGKIEQIVNERDRA